MGSALEAAWELTLAVFLLIGIAVLVFYLGLFLIAVIGITFRVIEEFKERKHVRKS